MARILPAIALVLGISIALAGCRSLSIPNELLQINGSDGVYAHGHAVSATKIGGRLYYRMQSVLAGKKAALACGSNEAYSIDGTFAVRLSNCLPRGNEFDATSLLPPFLRANNELGMYFPDVGAKQITVVALPLGVSHSISHRGWRRSDALTLEFALWWNAADDASLREAVRSFAHELTHLAVKAKKRRISDEDGELLASSFENCIEFAVFGNLSIDPDERSSEMLLQRVNSEVLRKSIAGSQIANNRARDWPAEQSLGDIRQRCRAMLDPA